MIACYASFDLLLKCQIGQLAVDQSISLYWLMSKKIINVFIDSNLNSRNSHYGDGDVVDNPSDSSVKKQSDTVDGPSVISAGTSSACGEKFCSR